MSSPSTTQQSAAGQAVNVSAPRTTSAFRKIKMLAGGYLAISLAAIVAIVVLRHHTAEVNAAVWAHGIIVAASAVLAFLVAQRAARGSRGAFRRLRIISVVLVAAIAVIIALPGDFPVWMKAEQGVCGLLMLGVAALANGNHLRSLFAR
jgi:peptidoglycan/LPS O-acetylase OafA/YrhL